MADGTLSAPPSNGKKLKVVIATQNSPLFLPTYLDKILHHAGHSVVAILVLPSFEGPSVMAKKTWGLFGAPVFLYLGFQIAFGKIWDHLLLFMGFHSRFSVRGVARRYGIPVVKTKNINAMMTLTQLREMEPDIIFSLAAPQKFEAEVLSLPKRGCFNIHSSLLPAYRGINAIFWAMLHGEQQTGFTIHKMSADLDCGPVIWQETVPIESGESYFTVCRKVIERGAPAVARFLNLQEDAICLGKNLEKSARYFGFPTAADRRQFYSRGGKFLSFF